MAKLSDREAERFIAQASPDAAPRHVDHAARGRAAIPARGCSDEASDAERNSPEDQRGGKIDDQGPPRLAEEIARFNEGG
jgi:hypothetical protein